MFFYQLNVMLLEHNLVSKTIDELSQCIAEIAECFSIICAETLAIGNTCIIRQEVKSFSSAIALLSSIYNTYLILVC